MLNRLIFRLKPKVSLTRIKSIVNGGLMPGVKFVANTVWIVPDGAMTRRISPNMPPNNPPMSRNTSSNSGDFLRRISLLTR